MTKVAEYLHAFEVEPRLASWIFSLLRSYVGSYLFSIFSLFSNVSKKIENKGEDGNTLQSPIFDQSSSPENSEHLLQSSLTSREEILKEVNSHRKVFSIEKCEIEPEDDQSLDIRLRTYFKISKTEIKISCDNVKCRTNQVFSISKLCENFESFNCIRSFLLKLKKRLYSILSHSSFIC